MPTGECQSIEFGVKSDWLVLTYIQILTCVCIGQQMQSLATMPPHTATSFPFPTQHNPTIRESLQQYQNIFFTSQRFRKSSSLSVKHLTPSYFPFNLIYDNDDEVRIHYITCNSPFTLTVQIDFELSVRVHSRFSTNPTILILFRCT